jgi:hypothetical protein
MHAAVWVQSRPSSDDQVRLDRWLALRGGSPLPLVDEDIWAKSLRPRHRPAPPPPPSSLELSEDWDPGEDPQIRLLEEARAYLIERLLRAGSAAALGSLESFAELRLLASFLWLPRDSAPLRRLGLRIQPPASGMSARATLAGPGFLVELDNYRFLATTRSRQAALDTAQSVLVAAHPVTGAPPTPPNLTPTLAAATAPPTAPLQSGLAYSKGSLGNVHLDAARPTVPLDGTGPEPSLPAPMAETQPPTPEDAQPGRRFWRFQLNRRNAQNAQS